MGIATLNALMAGFLHVSDKRSSYELSSRFSFDLIIAVLINCIESLFIFLAL